MQESTKFNGKRNLGITGYRLWGMGYGLQVSLGHCRILNEELANDMNFDCEIREFFQITDFAYSK